MGIIEQGKDAENTTPVVDIVTTTPPAPISTDIMPPKPVKKGGFVKGHKLQPSSHDFAVAMAAYKRTLFKTVKLHDMKEIVEAGIASAKTPKGIFDRKLILEYCVGKPKETVEISTDTPLKLAIIANVVADVDVKDNK